MAYEQILGRQRHFLSHGLTRRYSVSLGLMGMSGTLFGYGRRAIEIARIRNIFTECVTIDVQKMSKNEKKLKNSCFAKARQKRRTLVSSVAAGPRQT